MEPQPQPPQSQPPIPPQQPLNQPPVPTPPQFNGAPASASTPSESFKAKLIGAILTLAYGLFTVLTGLVSITASAEVGLLIVAVAIAWIVYAVKALSNNGAKAATALRVIAIIAMVYAGILVIAGVGLPGFSIGAAVFPVVFAVVMSILANKYSVSIRS